MHDNIVASFTLCASVRHIRGDRGLRCSPLHRPMRLSENHQGTMKKVILAAVCVAAATGCTTVRKQPMDAKAATSLKAQTVAYTVRKKPDFAAMTAGKAAFAMIGALAMISEGNGIVATHNIDDPAASISTGLAKALEERHASRLVTPPISVSADDAEQVAASAKGGAKFVLDVQTINWSFGYFPTDWTHYRVLYVAKARLIDADTRNVVAEGACRRIPETNAGAPTYDELLADGAARLKKELAISAASCVQTLKTEMLSL
jgi:hypothetical protein